MTIVARIYTGHKIVTEDNIYEVIGNTKMRSGYKYICKDKAGRKISLDRNDILEAQKEGSATVTM